MVQMTVGFVPTALFMPGCLPSAMEMARLVCFVCRACIHTRSTRRRSYRLTAKFEKLKVVMETKLEIARLSRWGMRSSFCYGGYRLPKDARQLEYCA